MHQVGGVGTAQPGNRSFEGVPPGPGRLRNTLFWALFVPTTATVAAFLTQYPYGLLYVGVLAVLAVAAAGATVAGLTWKRAGAATVVGFGTLALSLFAGSNLNEMYLKQFGDRGEAVVAEIGEHAAGKDRTRSYCRLVDGSGTLRELRAIQNCRGQFEEGQRVVLYEDPLGGLAPWMEAADSRTLDPLGLGITGGLYLLVGGTLFYAGQRRRSDRDLLERHRRRHGMPWNTPQ